MTLISKHDSLQSCKNLDKTASPLTDVSQIESILNDKRTGSPKVAESERQRTQRRLTLRRVEHPDGPGTETRKDTDNGEPTLLKSSKRRTYRSYFIIAPKEPLS